MLKTTVSKQALVKDGCCVIQAGTGSPVNNDFISSISWQQTDSLGVGIVWQQPHLHLHACKISQHSVFHWLRTNWYSLVALRQDDHRLPAFLQTRCYSTFLVPNKYGRISASSSGTGSDKEATDEASLSSVEVIRRA